MIVVLSYNSDGSGKPDLVFFPDIKEQAEYLSVYLSGIKHKTTEVFKINSLTTEVVKLYPKE